MASDYQQRPKANRLVIKRMRVSPRSDYLIFR